jgi:hypothetical protein
MDREIFQLLTSGDLVRERMRDVFPDKPYLVRFLGSAAEKRVGMVMIDLDRDGQFEERWDFKPGQVHRTVHADPNAGGQPVMYTLHHGHWLPH